MGNRHKSTAISEKRGKEKEEAMHEAVRNRMAQFPNSTINLLNHHSSAQTEGSFMFHLWGNKWFSIPSDSSEMCVLCWLLVKKEQNSSQITKKARNDAV
jgi:hypothetical protein